MSEHEGPLVPPHPPADAVPFPDPTPPAARPRRRQRIPRRGRPAFGLLVAVVIVVRFGRIGLETFANSTIGQGAGALISLAGLGVMLAWRAHERGQIEQRGAEFTADMVTEQIATSELGPPAFAEDGTLLGASIFVVNQRSKVLELITEYDVFGSDGQSLGRVRQIGQSGGKLLARFFTAFDQFFTHHFEILDRRGHPVLRLTRPRKIFRSKLHVFDGQDRFYGTIRQLNVFWKIRFELLAWNGQVVGHLRAENLRAWDFDVYDAFDRPVATVVKSWEGWARTAFTRADRYVVRVHEPLPDPLRHLTVAAALAADLSLKQDARGFG